MLCRGITYPNHVRRDLETLFSRKAWLLQKGKRIAGLTMQEHLASVLVSPAPA